MKHLQLGAFSIYLIHVWVPTLPAKHWENTLQRLYVVNHFLCLLPSAAKGFILWYLLPSYQQYPSGTYSLTSSLKKGPRSIPEEKSFSQP